uniref:Uncharacterized protein n=1 Tax=Glossina morsitans morsitans TaxID=37546 RepID=A0A1B0GC02_GLOMM
MVMDDNSDIHERTPEGSESPELCVERSSVVANVSIGRLLIKFVIDTGATRTIIKYSLQDFIPFVSEAPNISTAMRHREFITAVHEGETHFPLPLIVLDEVFDNLTLGVDCLIKEHYTVGNTVQRLKDSWSDTSFDTVTNPAYVTTSVRDPASSSVVETKYYAFIRQAPTKKRDDANHVDLPNEQRIKRIHQTPPYDVRDKFKPSEPPEKFSLSRSTVASNTCVTNIKSRPDRTPDAAYNLLYVFQITANASEWTSFEANRAKTNDCGGGDVLFWKFPLFTTSGFLIENIGILCLDEEMVVTHTAWVLQNSSEAMEDEQWGAAHTI